MKLAVVGATGLVGSQVVAQANAAGHHVIALSRSQGVDITDPSQLAGRMHGADAVIDVTQSPFWDERAATEFFEASAHSLARAAASVGVPRTVLLSVVGANMAGTTGADPAPDSYDGYLRAKGAQERAAHSQGHGVHVVRATQSHNFVGQVLGRAGEASAAYVDDLVLQPVDLALVVEVLLAVADARRHDPTLEVAGPRPERLAAMAEEFVAYYREDVAVLRRPVSAALRSGILLPGSSAVVGGPHFREWLHQHPRC
jgi:uncharacterized protein YbjT (DUF2867 family)